MVSCVVPSCTTETCWMRQGRRSLHYIHREAFSECVPKHRQRLHVFDRSNEQVEKQLSSLIGPLHPVHHPVSQSLNTGLMHLFLPAPASTYHYTQHLLTHHNRLTRTLDLKTTMYRAMPRHSHRKQPTLALTQRWCTPRRRISTRMPRKGKAPKSNEDPGAIIIIFTLPAQAGQWAA
jgi:hypothetical protein